MEEQIMPFMPMTRARDVDHAMLIIAGTARSMGVDIDTRLRKLEQAKEPAAGDKLPADAAPAAADDELGPALRDRRGPARRAVDAVVRAGEGAVVVAPHLQDDLQGLLEALEALGDGRERDSEPLVLVTQSGLAKRRRTAHIARFFQVNVHDQLKRRAILNFSLLHLSSDSRHSHS